MSIQLDKKICIASIATPDMRELSEITMNNKIEYCQKNNYAGCFLTQSEAYLGFDKILFIEGLLNTGKYSYVYWCDCDTIFTNFNKKIEDLIDETHHFFICTDYSQNINAGVFIFKNSKEGMEYLKEVKEKMYELAPQNKFKFGEEQTAIMATYKDPKYKDIIKILPQKSMNAYPYSDKGVRDHNGTYLDSLNTNGDWTNEDLMIHIPGFGKDFYQKLVTHFRSYIQKVIK